MTVSRSAIPIGIMFSTAGPYAGIGSEALGGALMALAEINGDAAFPFTLRAELGDPRGIADRYPVLADEQLRAKGCRHIVGGVTSWSRKDMIPVVERSDGLLWYAFPYEGYEANDHVIYLGAAPNQHIVPLFDYVTPRHGVRPFLVGSNYIWGWETNRIARELIAAVGGEILGERCLPLGSTDVERVIAEIRHARPDFVLCNLLGPSAHAFLAAYAALAAVDTDFGTAIRPVVSCNLTEIDLAEVGPAALGQLSTATYFSTLATSENEAFQARAARHHGRQRTLSSCFVAGYTGVTILAEAIRDAGTDDPKAVHAIATRRTFETPTGRLAIDACTNHAALRPHIGRVVEGNLFEVLESTPTPLAPDPYLVELSRAPARPARRPVPPSRQDSGGTRLRVIQ